MLGAFSMETLFKMVIIGNAYQALGDDIRKGEVAKSVAPAIHDLRELLDKSKLATRTNIKDRAILDQLTEFGVWKGRYPTPLAKGANTYHGAGAFDRNASDLWVAYVPLYEKLHRIAFRKVYGRSKKQIIR